MARFLQKHLLHVYEIEFLHASFALIAVDNLIAALFSSGLCPYIILAPLIFILLIFHVLPQLRQPM